MSPNPVRLPRRLASAGLILLSACQAEDRLAPVDPPTTPPPNVTTYAFYLDIDVVNGRVTVVAPRTADYATADRTATSLTGSDVVGMTTSNFFRSAIGQLVANKRTITFDISLTNKLSVTDLVTPTFPLPPAGAQGILAFPYTVAAFGVQGGKATPNSEWNGTGATGSGKPFNFFNDFASCGTAVTSDCYRWEMFPTPLRAGQSTPAQKVGFTVDKAVTSVGVYVVVAADLLDHPPTPQPGQGAVMGTVSSPTHGALAGATVTLTPGGQSVTTDGVGKYLLTALPVGSFTAAVSGLPQGCTTPASSNVTITSGGVTTADFSVTCQAPTRGSITGNASSPQLGPFVGVGVELHNAAGAVVDGTITDAAGNFEFLGRLPGDYTVLLTGLPLPCPQTSATSVTVTAGVTSTATLSVDCIASGTGSVIGKVSWPAGSLAEPVLVLSAPSGANATTMSDPTTGAYALSIAGGQVTVRLSAVPTGCSVPADQTVTVLDAGTVTVDINVSCPNPVLFGQLTSPTLGALSGVTISETTDGVSHGTTQTDAGGNFTFDNSIKGPGTGAETIGLSPSAGLPAGCTLSNPAIFTRQPGGTVLALISVDCSGGGGGGGTTGTITGTIDATGFGPVVATLKLSFLGITILTQSAPGTFTLRDLQPGDYTVDLFLPSVCQSPGSIPVTVQAGHTTNVPITVTCTSSPYIGDLLITLTDGFGSSLTNVDVTLTGPSQQSLVGTTDGLGQVPGTGLEAGQWTATVGSGLPARCDVPPSTSFRITAGSKTNLVITPPCASPFVPLVNGQVSSPTRGLLDGVTVQIQTVMGTFATQTSGGGDFQFDSSICSSFICQLSNPLGTITVTGGLPAGCATPSSISVPSVSPGAVASVPVSVDCSGAGSLLLSVSDSASLSLPGVEVVLQGPAGNQGAITDAAGLVQLSGLPVGSYSAALGQGLPVGCSAPAAAAFQISTGAETGVSITPTCPPIIGRVISPTLGPLSGVTVQAGGRSNVTTVTDAGGNFSINDSIRNGDFGIFPVSIQLTGGLPASCVTPAPVGISHTPGFMARVTVLVVCGP